jgi:hypothetical protein
MKIVTKRIAKGWLAFFALSFVLNTIPLELSAQQGWPLITKETKPWTRWWWMGSAVDEPNLTRLMATYSKAGFGGVEITPIYGTVGFESKYLKYLSPEWMKALDVSVREAAKNGMGVDMNTGTGWPFGGPQIKSGSAASKFILQKYQVRKGEKLSDKLVPADPRQADAPLSSVMAFGSDGKVIDLTDRVNQERKLDWIAGEGDWQIYATFSGKTLQKVKRAAPGGEGLTLDHFSKTAVETYLSRFDSAFQQSNRGVRCFFNDSYEVYGTNWTPRFFTEFQQRRGYPLQSYLRELEEKVPSTEVSRRVQCDYRETISDILLSNFTQTWTKWANAKGSRTKNQAHGSPGNLLDLYAAVDIPECETFGSSYFAIPGLRRDSADIRNVDPDPVMMKFASSAAHVSGKNLTSSETFTWLAEHFRVSLSQCKPEVEQVFLSGVNHVFYHGTAYSPQEAGWPGWLFYASVNFAPSNSFWPHLNGLNEYITRCQSVLQSGTASNDLLVYWPVYDVWMNPEKSDIMLTIHSIDKWLYPSAFYQNVKSWMKQGWSLDFVSDRLLNDLTVKDGKLVTRSGNSYKTLVIPACKYMSEITLRRITDLARQGAIVIFQQLPQDVPGLSDLEKRRTEYQKILKSISLSSSQNGIQSTQVGQGEILLSDQVQKAFELKNISREPLVDTGLKYIRRQTGQGIYYYLVNHSPETVDSFVPLNASGETCLLLDPQTGATGLAQTKTDSETKVRLQLRSGEAMFVFVSGETLKAENWKYLEKSLSPMELNGKWKLSFTDGGTVIPKETEIQKLVSWTELPSVEAQNFSGTGVYETTFDVPVKSAGEYLLDLGKVCESARVWVNGQDAGILWSIPFTARIGRFLKPGTNSLKIEVANLMANRIRQMDQQKVQWRNYHEINFVNINYKDFDASGWKPMPSGLLGPVKIIPVLIDK